MQTGAARDGPALGGQHKQITCMFVDIVGSLALSDELGSEVWADVLDRFCEVAADTVQRQDGIIHQFTGDGVMAIFGAPVALEDHARRACLAALRLHERIRGADERLQVRIGLHSGEAVIAPSRVGAVGDLPVVTVVGGTVGIARRIESLAATGCTMLSAQTASLVAGEFDLIDQGPTLVRGLRDPIGLVQLTGVSAPRDQLSVLTARGALTPLVGRSTELQLLKDQFADVRRGQPSALVVIADPGVGKTRLIHEFVTAAPDVEIIWARSVPQGRRTPYLLLLDFLRRLLSLDASDSSAVSAAEVLQAVTAIDPELAEEAPLLQGFLVVEEGTQSFDPQARERRLLAAVARILALRSRTRTQLVVIDDLQWADAASTQFFDELHPLIQGSPVLFLGTARAGWIPTWSRSLTLLRLAALSSENVDTLARQLLGGHPSVQAVAAEVALRAAGNPYFCEELVRGLVEGGNLQGRPGDWRLAGSSHPPLPPSIQASLAERLDRLSQTGQALIRYVSLVGREAGRDFLDAALSTGGHAETDVDAALGSLVVAGLLVEQVARVGDPATYTVAHPLIAEVAEATMLTDSKRVLHAQVADAMESVWGGSLEPRAALVAQHREAAGQDAKAANWYVRAATWSGFTSPAESLRLWECARDLADRLPSGGEGDDLGLMCRLAILGQAWRVRISEEAVQATYDQLIERLADRPDDDLLRVLADFAYSVNLHFQSRVDEGVALARVNLARVLRLGDKALTVLIAGSFWYGALTVGAFQEAFTAASEALEFAAGDTTLGRGFPGVSDQPYAIVLFGRGYSAAFLGDVPAGVADLEQAIALTEDAEASEVEPTVRSGMSFIAAMLGDSAAAHANAEASLVSARRTGIALALNAAYLAHVWAGWSSRDVSKVRWAAQEMLTLAESSGVGLELGTFAYGGLADAALVTGDIDLAMTYASRALDTSLHPSALWAELVAQLRMAAVLGARDTGTDRFAAATALRRAWAVRERTSIRICDPWLHRACEAHARLEGDEIGAARHAREAERAVTNLRAGTTAAVVARAGRSPRV